MKDALQSLKWDVFPAYEWKNRLNKKGRAVVVPEEQYHSEAAVTRAWKLYGDKKIWPLLGKVIDSGDAHPIEPMAEVGLFKTFAELNYADPHELLAFAQRYGNLRRSHNHKHQAQSGGHFATGEPHLQWAFEIVQMREAMQLSSDRSSERECDFKEARKPQIRTGFVKHVVRFGKELDDAEGEDGKVPYKVWFRKSFDHPGVTKVINVIPPREKEQKRLTALINHHLEQVQPRIVIGEVNRMSYGPLELLSSMWLQFALALIDHLEYRQCKNCGKTFEISSDGYQRNREFCDRRSCKVEHHRKRKRWALKLASSKPRPSLSNIAKTVGTDTKTLLGWIEAAKKKKARR